MFIFQSSALSHAQTFIDVLARTAEHQLLQYDNLLVIDDVIKGRKWNLQILTVIILFSYTITFYICEIFLWYRCWIPQVPYKWIDQKKECWTSIGGWWR